MYKKIPKTRIFLSEVGIYKENKKVRKKKKELDQESDQEKKENKN